MFQLYKQLMRQFCCKKKRNLSIPLTFISEFYHLVDG